MDRQCATFAQGYKTNNSYGYNSYVFVLWVYVESIAINVSTSTIYPATIFKETNRFDPVFYPHISRYVALKSTYVSHSELVMVVYQINGSFDSQKM